MLNFEPFVFVQESMQGFSNKDNIYNNAGTVALEDFFKTNTLFLLFRDYLFFVKGLWLLS